MEPKKDEPKKQEVSSYSSGFGTDQSDANAANPLTEHMLHHLINEFRQLQLEVALLKSAD